MLSAFKMYNYEKLQSLESAGIGTPSFQFGMTLQNIIGNIFETSSYRPGELTLTTHLPTNLGPT